jgi:salicylate hydroxylase
MRYSGQGAAQAFEDAAVLGVLFSNITNKTQISEILLKYEKIRAPRTEYLSHRSLSMKEIFAMKDGDAQRNRDIQLLQNEPMEGFPNPFSDPVLSKAMWEYDAGKAVDESEREDA